MKIIVIGAGIGGCASAVAFAQKGYEVLVLEKLNTIFTEGAGICLYSNALKSLDSLSVLDQVLSAGYVMAGNTEFFNNESKLLGHVNYKSIDDSYPAYVGINRQTFLEILYNKAKSLGVEFKFSCEIIDTSQAPNTVSVTLKDGTKLLDYNLLIASNGTNSNIRKQYWENSSSVYSGFGLWHSMHKLHPMVKEKNVVVMPDRRFGVIPISNTQMYIWASLKQSEKIWVPKDMQAKLMYREFNNLSGFLKDIIEELNDAPYVHYTAVEEVTIDDSWHRGRIVLLGDAAHASLPFMAQGGAMALQDAVVLSKLVSEYDLNTALDNYFTLRKPVVDTVQQMCRKIGTSYNESSVDLNKIQHGLNSFYSKTEFFN
jgi:2-polyprenyl-6-methoxyphenol hydroxylase-like FAD-dependent oxidoreductase